MKDGYYRYVKGEKVYLMLIYDGQFYFPKENFLMRSLGKYGREFYAWVDGLPEYKRKENKE